MEFSRTCYRPKAPKRRSSLCSMFQSFRNISHIPNRIQCKAPDPNWRPVWAKGACSESSEPHTPAELLHMVAPKAWKPSLAWFWINLNQSLQVFASVQRHRGCLRKKFYNSGMLCVSLVMLLSSWKYHLKCDLQKFGENGIIHGQPGFEKTETNMFITMHTALDRNRTQIRSFSYDQRETA